MGLSCPVHILSQELEHQFVTFHFVDSTYSLNKTMILALKHVFGFRQMDLRQQRNVFGAGCHTPLWLSTWRMPRSGSDLVPPL